VGCQIYRIAGYRFGASEITALFCDLREFAFLNRRSRANFCLDAGHAETQISRPANIGRRLVTTGTAKRRLGRRWLAENERKPESQAQAQFTDRAAIN
jgi:hypothetical protein